MSINKQTRLKVHKRYDGHCAYCGKEIVLKDMQIDHIIPKRNHGGEDGIDDIGNLNPSCRRCNHYKRASSVDAFRYMLKTLHNRIRQNYICKVAEDYGIITVNNWDGKFYFEKIEGGWCV